MLACARPGRPAPAPHPRRPPPVRCRRRHCRRPDIRNPHCRAGHHGARASARCWRRMAGLLLASRLGVGSPTVGSQGGYDLLSIAAVVLGGTLLAGGKGSIAGTLGGVAIFAVLDNVMGVMQVNPFLKDCRPRRSHRGRRRRLRPSPDRPPTGPVPRNRVRGNARGPACDRGGRHEYGSELRAQRDSQAEPCQPFRAASCAPCAHPGGAVFVLLTRCSWRRSSVLTRTSGSRRSLSASSAGLPRIAIAAIGQYFVIVAGRVRPVDGIGRDRHPGRVAGNLIGQDDVRIIPVLVLMLAVWAPHRTGQRLGHNPAQSARASSSRSA